MTALVGLTWQALRRLVLRRRARRLSRQIARNQDQLVAFAENHGAELLAAVVTAVNYGRRGDGYSTAPGAGGWAAHLKDDPSFRERPGDDA